MCQPATCKRCGKRTWRGCGQHVSQVMAGVPRSRQCSCEPQAGGGLLGSLRQLLGRN